MQPVRPAAASSFLGLTRTTGAPFHDSCGVVFWRLWLESDIREERNVSSITEWISMVIDVTEALEWFYLYCKTCGPISPRQRSSTSISTGRSDLHMKTNKRTLVTAGFLIIGFGAATPAFAINGCTNQNIIGAYNAQITSAAFTNVINTLNLAASSSTGSTGTTGATGTTGTTGATGTTGSTTLPGGS